MARELKEYIVTVRNKHDIPALLLELNEWGCTVTHVYKHAINGFSAKMSGLIVKWVQDDPRVLNIEQTVEYEILTKQVNAQHHLDRIDQRKRPLSTFYTHSKDGTNVISYILDSGATTIGKNINGDNRGFKHNEFGNRITAIADPNNLTQAFDPFFDSLNEDDQLNNPRGFDSNGHGTHVAGILGSQTYGVAKNVIIRTSKVFGTTNVTSSGILIQGVDAIIDDHINSGSPKAVCNMSLGGNVTAGTGNTSFELSILAMIARGITVVVAAGNSGKDVSSVSPARMPEVITVGAIDKMDSIANFSNFGDTEDIIAPPAFGFSEAILTNTGPEVDIFAPGVNVLSTYNRNSNDLLVLSGTSMSSPIVAGVVAMYLENEPNKPTNASDVNIIKQFIINNATLNEIDNLPVDTPNRIIYSYFVDHAIVWNTLGGVLKEIGEGFTVNIQLDVDSFAEQSISYSIHSGTLPIGITLDSNTGIISGVAPLVNVDTSYNFVVRAVAGTEVQLSDPFSITVLDGDLPPVISTNSNLGLFDENEEITIQFSASSRNGNLPITFSVIGVLPQGLFLSPTGLLTGNIPLVVNTSEVITFTINVNDGLLNTEKEFTFRISQQMGVPPVWETPEGLLNTLIVDNNFKVIQLQASDPNPGPTNLQFKQSITTNDGSVFGIHGELPPGLILDEFNGIISGTLDQISLLQELNYDFTLDNNTTTISDFLTSKVYEFTIYLTDGAFVVGRNFQIVIEKEPNLIPMWNTESIELANISALTFETIQLVANDPDNGPFDLRYSIVAGELPPGMTINSNTGEIYGLPLNITEIDKLFVFTARVSDGIDFAERVFSIRINRVNERPEWITQPGSLVTINEGTTFSYSLLASDPNGDELVYNIIETNQQPITFDNNTTTFNDLNILDLVATNSELPQNLTLDSDTGIISGSVIDIDETTTYEFIVRVDDRKTNPSNILFSDRTFSITVIDGVLNTNKEPVWITSEILNDAKEGEHYYTQLQAIDTDGPNTLTYLLIAGNLPSGMALNQQNGIISGIPLDVNDVDTTYNFVVRAYDGALSVDKTFKITVLNAMGTNNTPIFNTPTGNLDNYDELSTVIFALDVVDPDGDTLTFSIDGGSLPPGLTINDDGIIIGVAPAVTTDTTFNFVVGVTDGNGATTTNDYSITIIDVPNIPPIWITDSDLGIHNEGVGFATTVVASDVDGGPLPLTYTDTSGSATHLAGLVIGDVIGLPTGYTLNSNGLITGVANVTGDTRFSFEITANDGVSNISRIFTILINEVAEIPDDRSDLYVNITGDLRREWKAWNTSSLIENDDIYELGNVDFGRVIEPRIDVINNLHTVGVNEISNVFGPHHQNFDVLMGVLKSAVVRDTDSGEILYEVIYQNILDYEKDGSDDIITDYATRDNPIAIDEKAVSKSFTHLRNELNVLSNSEILPAWMTSEQIIGDPTSVIGYIPAIKVAYVKPGRGQLITSSLNEITETVTTLDPRETTFDENTLYGEIIEPTVTIGNTITITNGRSIPQSVTIVMSSTSLNDVIVDINDALQGNVDGVQASIREIEQFNYTTQTFEVGDVLILAFTDETITIVGDAAIELGLNIGINIKTSFDSNITTFDNNSIIETNIEKNIGLQFTGRKMIIDRYVFEDNITDITSNTTFTDGVFPTRFDINDGTPTTTFDVQQGHSQYIKFVNDSNKPVWITDIGTLAGFGPLHAVNIQLVANTFDVSETITFRLIEGSLPAGLSLNSTGLISGITDSNNDFDIYYFVIRAEGQNNNYSDRGFNIVMNGSTTLDNNTTTFDLNTTTF